MSRRAPLLLASLVLASCEDDPHPRMRRATLPLPTQAPPVLECRFEPVSRRHEQPRSGFEMCYSPSEPEPWWLRASASTTDAGKEESAPPEGEAPDAGFQPAPCPDGMVLVEGEYCPSVRNRCLRWLDEPGGAFKGKHRCAEYDENPSCASQRQHRRFCIDRDEFTPEGGKLPLVDQSWTGAKELCQNLGKRLCFESEWEFACEGEALLPYPYGFVRDATRCNHDRTDLTTRKGELRDLRVAPDELPRCTSPFGVRHMIGNVDEWTERDGFIRPWRASLRGGWWLAGRNNCRAATTGHDEYYFGRQTGFRCCANAR
jgi:formylglycine-generating enzyme